MVPSHMNHPEVVLGRSSMAIIYEEESWRWRHCREWYINQCYGGPRKQYPS